MRRVKNVDSSGRRSPVHSLGQDCGAPQAFAVAVAPHAGHASRDLPSAPHSLQPERATAHHAGWMRFNEVRGSIASQPHLKNPYVASI
jgi:hypothetical protein